MRYSLEIAKNHFKTKKIIAGEIGVWEGKFSSSIYNTLNISNLYLIDSWSLKYRKEAIMAMQKACTVMQHDNIHILRLESKKASEILNIKFDYLYLDNIHAPDYLYNELGWWWNKINNNGILAGHDYSSKRPKRVKAGLEKFCKKYKLTYQSIENNDGEEVGDWIIIKRNLK